MTGLPAELADATIVSSHECRKNIRAIMNAAIAGEKFVLTRHGHPVALLLPIESGHPKRISGPVSQQEYAFEKVLARDLQEAAFDVRTQVRFNDMRADIVLYDADNFPRVVIEVKVAIEAGYSARRVRMQVGRYARELGASAAYATAPVVAPELVGVEDGIRICAINDLLKELLANGPL